MPLDDVWKGIDKNVGFYWKGRFDSVPAAAGVYAWFYPLRVNTRCFDSFLDEVRRVHLYRAQRQKNSADDEDEENAATIIKLGSWSNLTMTTELTNPEWDPSKSNPIRSTWEDLVKDDEAFDRLRRILLSATLLMPPLYVGKAQNLRVRCNAHLNKSGFKKRFESYAREEKFPFTETKNLLLVTIKTEIVAERDAEIKDLVEEILKLVGRPPYGIV